MYYFFISFFIKFNFIYLQVYYFPLFFYQVQFYILANVLLFLQVFHHAFLLFIRFNFIYLQIYFQWWVCHSGMFPEKEVGIQGLGPYSQNFIFFVTYEWVQYARVFLRGKHLQPTVIQHSNLLDRFISYELNEVL